MTTVGRHGTTLYRRLGTGNVAPALTIIHINRQRSSLSCRHNIVTHYNGINIRMGRFLLPTSTSRSSLLGIVTRIGTRSAVRKYLLFHPLPGRFGSHAIHTTLTPRGSVSNVASSSLTNIFAGASLNCTPYATRTYLRVLGCCGVPLSNEHTIMINHDLIMNGPTTVVLSHRGTAIAVYGSHARGLPTVYGRTSIMMITVNGVNTINTSYLHRNRAIMSINVRIGRGNGLYNSMGFDRTRPMISTVAPMPNNINAIAASILINRIIRTTTGGTKLWQVVRLWGGEHLVRYYVLPYQRGVFERSRTSFLVTVF